MTNYYLLFFKVYKVLNSSNTPRLLALQLCVLQLCSAPQHFFSPLALSTLALSPPASSPSSLQLITFLTSNRYYFHLLTWTVINGGGYLKKVNPCVHVRAPVKKMMVYTVCVSNHVVICFIIYLCIYFSFVVNSCTTLLRALCF